MSLRHKTYVLLITRLMFSAFGDIALSRGMKQIGPVNFSSASSLWIAYLQVISSPMIWLGIALMLCFFFCHLLLFSWADYSFVMPTTAANYVAVPLLGLLVLGESVSFTRWVGVAIISIGVILVGWTHPVARQEAN
jgi:drug/metabolite transporter (DMT)-like permease